MAIFRQISSEFQRYKMSRFHVMGFWKGQQIPKIRKKLESSPHPNFFFRNPSLTWTEHSNHNNQQLLEIKMRIQTEYGILLHTSVLVEGYFGTIFQQKNFRVRRETGTHPPTSIVISDFWNFVFFAKPLTILSSSKKQDFPVIYFVAVYGIHLLVVQWCLSRVPLCRLGSQGECWGLVEILAQGVANRCLQGIHTVTELQPGMLLILHAANIWNTFLHCQNKKHLAFYQ